MKIFKFMIPAALLMTFGCAAAPQQEPEEKAETKWEFITPPDLSQQTQQLTTWRRGKFLVTQTICRSEKGIMKLVKADTESAEKLLEETIKLHFDPESDCMRLPSPAAVMILDSVTAYKDHSGTASVVLKISLTPRGPIAFCLAAGLWSDKTPEEEETTKKIAV